MMGDQQPYDSRPEESHGTEEVSIGGGPVPDDEADDDNIMGAIRLEGVTGFEEDGETFAVFYDIKIFRAEQDEDGELRRDHPPVMSHRYVLDRMMAAHENVWDLGSEES